MVVISFWIFVISCDLLRRIKPDVKIVFNLLVAFALLSRVLFILISYVILYRETLRHQKIKTQQLPQEEVERFVKESKALKTTVLVVGAILLCFVPLFIIILLSQLIELNLNIGSTSSSACTACPLFRTFAMLRRFPLNVRAVSAKIKLPKKYLQHCHILRTDKKKLSLLLLPS